MSRLESFADLPWAHSCVHILLLSAPPAHLSGVDPGWVQQGSSLSSAGPLGGLQRADVGKLGWPRLFPTGPPPPSWDQWGSPGRLFLTMADKDTSMGSPKVRAQN